MSLQDSHQSHRITVSVDEAMHALSIGRTKLYELLGDGALRSVTIGKKRLIIVASMHEYIANLERYGVSELRGHPCL